MFNNANKNGIIYIEKRRYVMRLTFKEIALIYAQPDIMWVVEPKDEATYRVKIFYATKDGPILLEYEVLK